MSRSTLTADPWVEPGRNPTPKGSEPMDFKQRFGDYFGSDGKWKQTARGKSFLDNQSTLEEYHKSGHDESPYHKGMFGDIARIMSFAAEFATNQFSAFIRDPIEWGDAVMAYYVGEVKSRPYDPMGKPIIDPALVASDSAKYGTYLREPDRVVQRPEIRSVVSKINFDREVPLGVSRRMIEQYATRGEQIDGVTTNILATAHAAYMNDMFAAAKEFFCGVCRVYPPGEDKQSQPFDFNNSPMIKKLNSGAFDKDTKDEFPNEMVEALTTITDKEFPTMSTKYNPWKRNTHCTSATIIVSKKIEYRAFKQMFADTFHPDYIDYAIKNIVWIDEFPEVDPAYISASATYKFELAGMVVDPRALNIIPWQSAIRSAAQINHQSLEEYTFLHYRTIFDMLPFLNRKYIFMRAPLT